MVSSARRNSVSRCAALLVAAALVVCPAVPLSASAATTRYASPTGTGGAHCVEPGAPCSIEDALKLENTTNGDTILLAPGTYRPSATLEVLRPLTISGEVGKPVPTIEAGGEFGLEVWEPSTIRGIRIQSPPGTISGLLVLAETGLVERVESIGEAAKACAGSGVFRDTLCSATPVLGGGEGFEMFLSGSAPSTAESELFNVTAIGGSVGIAAAANQNSTVILKATNTIASGGLADVVARSFAPTAPVGVILSHTNFAEVEAEGIAVTVTSQSVAGNQTAAPLFANAAGDDYREREGSPTRLAGDLGAVLPGEVDLAGNPRTTDCEGTIGVDIGAYQFECPTPTDAGTLPNDKGTGSGSSSNAVPPPPNASKPVLTKLGLKPSKFMVTGKGPKGTTVSFALSGDATVKLEVLQKKKVAKGKKPKTVVVGSLPSVAGKAGANSVKFSGKLQHKPLDPGKYTLRATATAGSLSSAPATKPFEVLAPPA